MEKMTMSAEPTSLLQSEVQEMCVCYSASPLTAQSPWPTRKSYPEPDCIKHTKYKNLSGMEHLYLQNISEWCHFQT